MSSGLKKKNGFGEKLIKVLAADDFNHPAQNVNPGAVSPVGSGIERQRDLRELFSAISARLVDSSGFNCA